MRLRVVMGRFLVRLGGFIQSLALMVMRPDDLVEFSRQTYARPKDVESWNREELVDSGLSSDETALLEKVPLKEGQVLLLGVGGGREAISLGRIGFEVTGVDFVPEMIQRARKNATRHGVRIEGLVQEISKLDVSGEPFDMVWLSAGMYSSVPTRKRRIKMLKRIGNALRPGGYFACQFHWDTRGRSSPKVEFARKAFAFLTLGNLWHEKGDILWGNTEFLHGFSSKNELRSEFDEGGFEVVYIHIHEGMIRGEAALKLKGS